MGSKRRFPQDHTIHQEIASKAALQSTTAMNTEIVSEDLQISSQFYLVFVVCQNPTFPWRNIFQELGEKNKQLLFTLLQQDALETNQTCNFFCFSLTCCNFNLNRKNDKLCAVWSIGLYSYKGCVIISFSRWKTGSHHSLGFIRRNFLTS